MYQAGLVLEGGGMKGVYTAGVLDFFIDKGLEFSSVYGVSAGACHMTSYLSKQRGRALDISIDYLKSRKYCSVESLLTTGDLFNVQTAYHLVPDYLNPFDYEAFKKYEGRAYAVATDIEAGTPVYFRIRDVKKDMDAIRASASLPLVSRNVRIGNHLYLDGGISDAIPIRKSILDGNSKNVVVLTKEEGFVRQPTTQLPLLKMRYFRYPKVAELMAERHITYNNTMYYLYEQQKNGQAFVIRPAEKSNVGRIEKDEEKLKALYKQGYADAEALYEPLLNYLES